MPKQVLDINTPLPIGRFKGKSLNELVTEIKDTRYITWLWFTVVENSYYFKLSKEAQEFILPHVIENCKLNKKYLDLGMIFQHGRYQGYSVDTVISSNPDYVEYLYTDCNYYATQAVKDKVKSSIRSRDQIRLMKK